MPVVEFALDPSTQQRIQVHLSAQQSSPITVMLNRSILGSLAADEQSFGKDFRLPDNSFLNVRVFNGQLQVARAGYPLPPVDATTMNVEDTSPAALMQKRKQKLGGCLVTWLIVNLLGIGILTAVYVSWIFAALAAGASPLYFILFSLFGLVGLVGISLIFFWKKLGFYLAATYVVLNFLLCIPLHLLDAHSFAPLFAISILYLYLNRSGVWEKMS